MVNHFLRFSCRKTAVFATSLQKCCVSMHKEGSRCNKHLSLAAVLTFISPRARHCCWINPRMQIPAHWRGITEFLGIQESQWDTYGVAGSAPVCSAFGAPVGLTGFFSSQERLKQNFCWKIECSYWKATYNSWRQQTQSQLLHKTCPVQYDILLALLVSFLPSVYERSIFLDGKWSNICNLKVCQTVKTVFSTVLSEFKSCRFSPLHPAQPSEGDST